MFWRNALDRSSLGFGLCWGIQLVLLFSRSLFGANREGADLFNYAIGFGLAFAAVVLFIAARVSPRKFDEPEPLFLKRLSLAYGIFLLIGVSFITLALYLPDQHALQAAGGAFSGAGLCLSYLLWTQLIARHDPDKTRIALTASLAEGVIFFALLVWAQPTVRIAGIALATVVSCVLCQRYIRSLKAPNPVLHENRGGTKLDDLATCATTLTIGFAYGASGLLSLNSQSVIQQNTAVWHLAVLVVGLVLFMVVTQLLPRRASVSLLFQLLFPLVVLVSVILPFASWWYWDIYNFILAGSFQLAEMILFFSFATSTLQGARFQSLCLPLACMWLGINVGVFFGSWLFGTEESLFFILASLVITTLFAFSTTMFVLALVWRQRALLDTKATPEGQVPESEALASMLDEDTDNAKGAQALLEQIAARYELTERETEIVGYLAKGRSSTYISEKLYLSPNTVRGYIRTAYAKLGVHSKQEVISLFDQADQEGAMVR